MKMKKFIKVTSCILCAMLLAAIVCSCSDDSYTYDYKAEEYRYGLVSVWKEVDGGYKYGFANSQGEVVIPCIYDETSSDIYGGKYIIVTEDDRQGVIDVENNTVIDLAADNDIRISDEEVMCFGDINISTPLENIAEINQMKTCIAQHEVKLESDTSEYSLTFPEDCVRGSYNRGSYNLFSGLTENGNGYLADRYVYLNVHRKGDTSKDNSLYLAKTYEEFCEYFVGGESADGVTVEKVDFSYSDSGDYEVSKGICKINQEGNNRYLLQKVIVNKSDPDDMASLRVLMLEDYYTKEEMDKISDSFFVRAK